MASVSFRLVRKLGSSNIRALIACTARSGSPSSYKNNAAGIRWLTSAQPSGSTSSDDDEAAASAAATAPDLLSSTPFVRREDQKMEEQKRRRLSDVSVLLLLLLLCYCRELCGGLLHLKNVKHILNMHVCIHHTFKHSPSSTRRQCNTCIPLLLSELKRCFLFEPTIYLLAHSPIESTL
jgi:hypothetical protein